MPRWTWTLRQSGTNWQRDELSSPRASQSWRAQQGPSRGGEINNQHQWRPLQLPISQRSWRAHSAPVEGGRWEVNTWAGGALEGMEEKRRTHDSFFSTFTFLTYVFLSDDFNCVRHCFCELLTRRLWLNSASTNKSFNLYFFRFLALKIQIQHQHRLLSLLSFQSLLYILFHLGLLSLLSLEIWYLVQSLVHF